MKNLFKSASCGNPAKFVWQNIRPGNTAEEYNIIEAPTVTEVVSGKAKNVMEKHIDITKTTLTELQAKLKELNAQKKQIDKWAEQQKADWEKTQMMNEYSNKQLEKNAEENVNKKLMVLTTAQELSLMAENGLSPQPGKTNREVLKPVLVQKEVNRLKQVQKEQYYAQIDEMAQEKRMNLRASSGESYIDLVIAENKLKQELDRLNKKIKEVEEIQEYLKENTGKNDPELVDKLDELNRDRARLIKLEDEAEARESSKNPFTMEQLGNSPYEMMKNIPGPQRQEAFKANFSGELFSNYKLGKGLTARGNTMLYNLLKDRLESKVK